MEFKDRLKSYRESLGINTKVAMAQKIGITRTLYSMLENGTREPSKDVLEKLFLLSNKPEEYWLYGVSSEEYLNARSEFKSSKDLYKQLSNLGLIGLDKEYSEEVKEVMLAALIADYTHLLEKEQQNK